MMARKKWVIGGWFGGYMVDEEGKVWVVTPRGETRFIPSLEEAAEKWGLGKEKNSQEGPLEPPESTLRGV